MLCKYILIYIERTKKEEKKEHERLQVRILISLDKRLVQFFVRLNINEKIFDSTLALMRSAGICYLCAFVRKSDLIGSPNN